MGDLKQNEESAKSEVVFDKCCQCIPLRTGCLIFGYLNLVACVTYVMICVLGTINAEAVLNGTYGEIDEDVKDMAVTEIKTDIINMIANLIGLLFTVFLLVGLHTERPRCVKIFLVYALIGTGLDVIFKIFQLLAGYAALKNTLIGLFIYLVYASYFLLVLWSQYVKMKIAANNLPTQHSRKGQLLMNMEQDA
ncbi:uncharacterized protein LOC123873306 [Maniola jurtina]|uniref:uncharacterized protein LOC123873306 n=1 Tax=Maniola jurtina TaxID=191418 RepID=UPI001E68E3F3|nr:uncharacterized protein LOC123873306 [Maniola jurtina]